MSNKIMSLPQRATFLANIISSQAVGQPLFGIVDETAIATYYNANSTIQVERTLLSKHDLQFVTSQEGTLFNWVGNGFITRAPGEHVAFREIFNSSGNIDPSVPSIKSAFADIFSGAGNGASNRTHFTAMSKRLCSRVEALFTTGTGTLVSPAILGFEGVVSAQLISNIINGIPGG